MTKRESGSGRLFEWFRNDDIQTILTDNQLGDFQSIWESSLSSVDTVNYRRSGWSGVFDITVTTHDDQPVRLFVKRQENHQFHHPWFFWIRRPTFYREYKNLLRADAFPVLVPECFYYGERKVDGKKQAIIIVRELKGFEPLGAVLERISGQDGNSRGGQKEAVLVSVIKKISEFHHARFQHGGLRAKHIYIKKAGSCYPLRREDIALIDMERTRRRAFTFLSVLNDVDQFFRGARFLSEQEVHYFLGIYFSRFGALAQIAVPSMRWWMRRKPTKWKKDC